MNRISKVLIANRGEIALRIIRTCREMGIDTVAVYSESDQESPHVLAADESVYIGRSVSSESYLSIEKMIGAAVETEADAIHPGYGFLSENAEFARRCGHEGLVFIGPRPDAIEVMGDKTAARSLAASAGVSCPPGSDKSLKDLSEAEKLAEKIGYPVLVKAAAGGGGKGMRKIEAPREFISAIKAARSEARNAFGDDRIYVEKYLDSPRHVEIQLIADDFGKILHLFDRECSIQRRHQKVIEEAPSVFLPPEVRKEMAEAAIAVARACNYLGAGTVEFLVDKEMRYYFLEMNTRLQVEHPVTELITDLDLVELQILIAQGEKLPLDQRDILMKGHAVECRIYAEDPEDNFLPSTGRLLKHRPPGGPGVRVDAGVEEGMEITINYDPMISKLCTFASGRKSSILKMQRALDEYEIAGCRTTIPFCSYVMHHPEFLGGSYDTHFVADNYDSADLYPSQKENEDIISIAASLLTENSLSSADSGNAVSVQAPNPSCWWRNRR